MNWKKVYRFSRERGIRYATRQEFFFVFFVPIGRRYATAQKGSDTHFFSTDHCYATA
jgi:hypothetical protein